MSYTVKALKPYYRPYLYLASCIKSSNSVVLGIRSGIIVFSMSLLLIMLFSISSLSSVGGGLTVGAGKGSYRGIELYVELDVAVRLIVGLVAL